MTKKILLVIPIVALVLVSGCVDNGEIKKFGDLECSDETHQELRSRVGGAEKNIDCIEGHVMGNFYMIGFSLLQELINETDSPAICDYWYDTYYKYGECDRCVNTKNYTDIEYAESEMLICIKEYCSFVAIIDRYMDCDCIIEGEKDD